MKYIRLFRLKTTVIYLFPLVLAFSAAVEKTSLSSPVILLFAYLSYFGGSFFSSTLNCYADIPADKFHDGLYKDQDLSKQPFVTGEITRAQTILVFLITGVTCVVFAFLVNLRFALFMLSAVLLLGILYSHPWFRFKEKPVLDAVTNATGGVLLLFAGHAIVAGGFPPILPSVYGWIFAIDLYLPTVANDAPFDEAAGYRTSGVVFGQKNLLLAMIPLSLILIPICVLTLLSPSINWQYKLFIGLSCPAAILYTLTCLYTYRPPHIEFNPLLLVVPVSVLLGFYFVYSLINVLR